MNLSCFADGGGGVGVKAGRGRRGRESALEDRERGVPSLLERSSLLARRVGAAESACHDRRRRSRSPLSLLLAEREYSLLRDRPRDSREGLRSDRRRLGDRSLEEVVEEWLEVLLRLGAGLSMSMATGEGFQRRSLALVWSHQIAAGIDAQSAVHPAEICNKELWLFTVFDLSFPGLAVKEK